MTEALGRIALGGRTIKSQSLLVATLLLCLWAKPSLALPLFGIEASLGYEYNDNVIYSPVTTEEGKDYSSKASVKLSFDPKFADWLSASFSCLALSDQYRSRPDYDTSGQYGEAQLMMRVFPADYVCLIAGSSAYKIGDQTYYCNKLISIQNMLDISMSGDFYTTIYFDNNVEGYSDALYEPLNNRSGTLGLKQNITKRFYVSAYSMDSTAATEDLSFLEACGSAGLTFGGPDSAELSLTASLSKRAYKEASTLLVAKREDDKASVSLSITKNVYKNISFNLIYTYTRNECNLKQSEARQGYASYTENIVGAALALKL